MLVDHANSTTVAIRCSQDARQTVIEIEDDGVGIFAKLRKHFDLDSDTHALIELVKGKLTVAPEAHSGEGIFFTSKMFDRFVIESGELIVSFEADECLVHSGPHRQGTRLRMEIANDSPRTNEFTFCKTRFFVSLAAFEGELTSRSQAKRVVARFEDFAEVELDFGRVDHIGQAFTDELVRVWPLAHPGTQLKITHARDGVAKMLKHVVGRLDLPQPSDRSIEDGSRQPPQHMQ